MRVSGALTSLLLLLPLVVAAEEVQKEKTKEELKKEREALRKKEEDEEQQREKAWADEDALRRTLLQDYDPAFRPASNVTLRISRLTIYQLHLDEVSSTLLIKGNIHLNWMDPRLKWQLAQHPDLDRLGVDPDKIWHPDLAVYHSGDTNTYVTKSQLPALVYPSGEVWFVPPVSLHLPCTADRALWPHDLHTCTLQLGSWLHSGHMLNITMDYDALQLGGGLVTFEEWQVVYSNVTRREERSPCCAEPMVHLLLSLIVRRSGANYCWTVKTPAVCLVLLTCVLFLLPPAAGEKMVVGGFCLLLDLLFLLHVSSAVAAHSPSQPPLIVSLAGHQVVLTAVSVVVAALLVRTARAPRTLPLPSALARALVTLAYPFGLSNYTSRTKIPQEDYAVVLKCDQIQFEGENCEAAGEDGWRSWGRSVAQDQWLLLAALLDRLFLGIYLITAVIILIRFSAVL